MVSPVLPRGLAAGKAFWMIKTTWDNLLLLKSAREGAGQSPVELDQIIQHLRHRYGELCGEEAKAGDS